MCDNNIERRMEDFNLLIKSTDDLIKMVDCNVVQDENGNPIIYYGNIQGVIENLRSTLIDVTSFKV